MEFFVIKSEPKYEISKCGIIRNRITKKIKSQYIGSTGYYMISISHNDKSHPYRVHRLFAETFIPNPNNYLEINHKDGDKLNNSIENIEWCNRLMNVQHAFATGLANNSGEKNGMAKLKSSDIPKIVELLNSGLSQYEISKMFGVSRSCIMNIKNRNQWKDFR